MIACNRCGSAEHRDLGRWGQGIFRLSSFPLERDEHEIVDASYVALHQFRRGGPGRPTLCSCSVRYQQSTSSFDRLWRSSRVDRRWCVTWGQALGALAAIVSEWRLGAAVSAY
jgi:hypothetical protein